MKKRILSSRNVWSMTAAGYGRPYACFLVLLLVLLCAAGMVGAGARAAAAPDKINGRKVAWVNAETFPDENFRAWINKNLTVETSYIDTQSITRTTEPFVYVDSVTFISCGYKNIASLEGVKKFTSLNELYCGNNVITSLDVSGLTNLEVLWCQNNRLTSLDVWGLENLLELSCDGNFDGSGNKLTSLDLSGLTKLKRLHCEWNQLTSLDLSEQMELELLSCNHNQLTKLDVPYSAETVYPSPQNCSTILTGSKIDSGACLYNLVGYCGLTLNDMPRVIVNNCQSFSNATGVATFKTEQTEITYLYSIYPDEDTEYMTVTIKTSAQPYDPDSINKRKVAWFNAEIFPDENFRTWINENLEVNTNYIDGQGITRTTDPFIYVDGVTSIDCESKNIASLVGVEKFTSLQELCCGSNRLNSLNLAGLEKLKTLNCDINSLSSLDLSGLTSLQDLECESNELSSLDLSGLTSLKVLGCEDNRFTSLDFVKQTNLQELRCSNNPLSSLDLSGLTSLKKLECSGNGDDNQLTSLMLSGLTNLQGLWCDNNQLTSLDLSGLINLQTLDCGSNQLTSLKLSGLTRLQTLDCSSNQLTSLDLSGVTNLQTLDCGSNQLTKLNITYSISSISLSPQTRSSILTGVKNDSGICLYNFVGYGGLALDDMPRMTVDGCLSFDNTTGVASFGAEQSEITYQYDAYPDSRTQYMSVTINAGIQPENPDEINGRKVAWVNAETFPDENFRAWISDELKIETEYIDAAGITRATDPFIYVDGVTRINCESENIVSLAGVEKFTSLEELWCGDNKLTSLALTGLTRLKYLYCSSNLFTELDLTGLTSLQVLYCKQSMLTSLDLTGLTSLRTLQCEQNQLTSLDLTGVPTLDALYCGYNSKLQSLNCSGTRLTSLSLPGLTSLQTVDCSSSRLISLDLSGLTSLQTLDCSKNQLPSLDLSELTNLQNLDCGSNQLAKLNAPYSFNSAAFSPQNRSSILTGSKTNNGICIYSFMDFCGLTLDDMPRMIVDDCLSFDKTTGIASFETEQTEITYQYDIYPDERTEYMSVTIKTRTQPDGSDFINGRKVAWVNEETFPDDSFRACISDNLKIETGYIDAQGITRTTDPFIYVDGVTSIDCQSRHIVSLEGVEKFINLQELRCSSNELTTLNLSELTNLEYLWCDENKLLSLDLTGLTNLEYLFCPYNQLASLNLSGLTNLRCLYCSCNQLASLDLSGLTNLQDLDCHDNQLATLDLSGLTNLQELSCRSNHFTKLDVPYGCNSASASLQACSSILTGVKFDSGICRYSFAGFRGLTLDDMPRMTVDDCLSFDKATGFAAFEAEQTEITYQYDIYPDERTEYISVTVKTSTHPDGPDFINWRKVAWFNAEIFPDDNFRAWITDNLKIETKYIDAQGDTQTVDPFIYVDDVTSIDCESSNIVSLTGLEKFTSLQELWCGDNKLPSLDLSGLINLRTLDCGGNLVASLNLSGLTNLQFLRCGENKLTSLKLSELTNLQELDCRGNQFTTLDLSGLTKLQTLDCGGNPFASLDLSGLRSLQELSCIGDGDSSRLTSLNLSGLTKLQTLHCSGNQLTTLDLSGPTKLQTLYCDGNQLPTLDLSGLAYLQYLDCSDNKLSTLDLSWLAGLQHLDCSDNQLTTLNLTGLVKLQYLNCAGNQLPTLDFLWPKSLRTLYCFGNQLPMLDLSGLTNLRTLDCSDNQLPTLDLTGLTNLRTLYCYDNQLPALDLSGLTNLQDLDCNSNQLRTLDLSGLTKLEELYCANNQLASLDLTAQTALSTLNCSGNRLALLSLNDACEFDELDFSEQSVSNVLTGMKVSDGTYQYNLACFSPLSPAEMARITVSDCQSFNKTSGVITFSEAPAQIHYQLDVFPGEKAEYMDVYIQTFTDKSNKVVRLPSTLKSIGSQAFIGSGADAVILPDTIEEIADDAFANTPPTLYVRNGSYAMRYAEEKGLKYVVDWR